MSKTLQNLSNALAKSVQETSPALVSVNGRRRMPATGIVWSADGLIVTAHHVVERNEDVTVTLHDGTVLSAEVVGRDPQNDLALLRVQGDLTVGDWAENDELSVGHLVLAMGSPTAQTQATLGVVSALVEGGSQGKRKSKGKRGKRGRHFPRALMDGFIRTDVVMYPGFSGGPLVSGDGKIHGLNTSGFRRGASIAIPVSTIRKSVEALLTHGHVKQGYLGVGIQPARLPEKISEELDQSTGLLISSIEVDSPAHKANLMVGDIIVSMEGEAITQPDELMMQLSGSMVGKEVMISIVRGGEMKEVSATITERS